jgi:hypothetical protein
MSIFKHTVVLALFCGSLYSQTIPETFSPSATLNADQCYDLIKTVWDGLKKISEEHQTSVDIKSEFETTTEFNDRVRKAKDLYANKVQKFFQENKLNESQYSVWMKAELVKYDADNQVYSVKSPTAILIQPKKKEIAVVCPANKYLVITEINKKGYRFANLQLNTEPEFSWFVNKQTAQSAKNKEHVMFFKVNFSFAVSIAPADNQIILSIIPSKIALLDQQENFTYWSDDIRL